MGWAVGWSVGCVVGWAVGLAVGEAVGRPVGLCDGERDGREVVGLCDGEYVGPNVASAVPLTQMHNTGLRMLHPPSPTDSHCDVFRVALPISPVAQMVDALVHSLQLLPTVPATVEPVHHGPYTTSACARDWSMPAPVNMDE